MPLCNKHLQGTPSKGAQKTKNRHFRRCEMPPLANEKRVHLREPLLSPDLEGPRRSTNLGDLRPPEQRSQAALRGKPGQLAKKVIFGFQKHKSVRKQAKEASLSKSERDAFYINCIISYHLHIVATYHIHLHHFHIVSIFIQQEKKQQHDSLLKRSP